MAPVLLVHGIWDDGARFDRMRDALDRDGIGPIHAIDLAPNDGSAPIELLAAQVDREARALIDRSGSDRIDLVGFSMGALVSRFWLQRRGGRMRVRRFVSISGPHEGTLIAYAMTKAGVKQMRPSSDLLRALAQDADPWGEVEVHSVWTPFDLMIVPPRSSRLPACREHVLPVPLHRWMITDARAIARVSEILRT